MSRSDIQVRLSVVDQFTPELLRARYRFLTPIGRRVPPRGTMAWDQAVLRVRLRQLGRVIVRDVPGASAVPWAEVGRIWDIRLQRLGTAYIVLALLAVLLYLTARLVGLA